MGFVIDNGKLSLHGSIEDIAEDVGTLIIQCHSNIKNEEHRRDFDHAIIGAMIIATFNKKQSDRLIISNENRAAIHDLAEEIVKAINIAREWGQ